ncbi:2-hydroxyacid dehydrogenase [Glutamicibacter ardleyensis]|uniref:Dehydrogenase n=1 Tax=Glutamicibacter ardleyensis TaxID=225894 RepID=A0ABQ2DF65_9MICC|nr:2-hydroxyacid dehydrogenase [Glutamicibacter ardleyensis]GGJ53726.1 dehydrogenase [Glutamicibacter ardleyensis]
MTLRVLVPNGRLLAKLDVPGVTPIYWHLNDSVEEAPEADVLITERPLLVERRARVSRIPGLRHVHLLSLGYEWVLEHLPPDVSLSNSRGAVEDATAEHTLALVLASLRELPAAGVQQQKQVWNPLWGGTLHGATVLLLGFGGVGQEIYQRLLPFKPKEVFAVASSARQLDDGTQVHGIDEMPDLLPQAQLVIVALPDAPSTRGIVDDKFLASMPDRSLLVNVGRGPVVDTEALLFELQSERLCAALDVTDPEPLPEAHPLWTAPNCLITPHIAGNTSKFIDLAMNLAVEQVKRLAVGQEPLHLVRVVGPAN